MEKVSLDPVERRILSAIQEDATLPLAALSARAGLSQTACWRRLKRLRSLGVVRAECAVLDRTALGLDFVAYTAVKLALPDRANMAAFERAVEGWPEVVLCEKITGAVDYLIKVVCRDIHDYDDFLRDRLMALGLVADSQSRVVVATVKERTALPIPPD